MHPEPHTDLNNLNSMQHNLRTSAKGSNDAYDVTVSLARHDGVWYKIVERGLRLGLMDTVDEADIFRDHNGKLVLNGAMGVPKLKRFPDGSTVELQRFISNLVPECLLSPLAG